MVNDSSSEQVNNELFQNVKMEKIDDSSSIEQIKKKYKDLYDIDVEVEYDEENNVYLIETKNDEIIYATDSLDKELDRLKNIEENSQRSGGGGYLPSPQSVGTRRQERALNADEVQIYMFFSSMYSIISDLDSMASMPLNCNTSYADCLSGELRTYYDGLGDNTKAALKALANSISGISGATNKSLILYDNTSKEDLKDLEDLINTIYDESDMKVLYNNFMDQDIGDTPMSYDEYAYIFDNMGELFDPSYQNILDRFKSNLALGYQDFLRNMVPSTLNNIVENTYLRISDEDIGSEAYFEGLEKYKNSFALKVLGDFDLNSVDIENSNIPSYLWEKAENDYDKTLLVLSYNNDNFSNSYRDNFINALKGSAEENDLYVEWIEDDLPAIRESFSIMSKGNEFYTCDYDEKFKNCNSYEKVSKIVNEYNNLLKDFKTKGSMSELTFKMYFAANPSYDDKSGNAWKETLEELGYLKNINFDEIDVNENEKTKIIFDTTFNTSFFGKVIAEEGQAKAYEVLKMYYTKYGGIHDARYGTDITDDKLDELFRSYNPYLLETAINYSLMNEVSIVGGKLVNDKVTLDAIKANFKMGLLESLDTSDITEEDIDDAKHFVNLHLSMNPDFDGYEAKYLDDWQLKAFYKILKEDPLRAQILLKDTLYNTIQEKKGLAAAESDYKIMTGETQKQILGHLIGDEVFNGIFGKSIGYQYTVIKGFVDGINGSVKNVVDCALADGKMESSDYYSMYLQEMLSTGGFHNDSLKLLYNASSSVGYMAPALALSAFVSPAAMSWWIFLSTVGSEREKTLRSGEGESVTSVFNAVAKGLLAVGTERFLGALKGYGGKADDLLGIFKMDNKFIQKFMGTTFGKKFALGLSNSVHETIEELVENYGGYGIDFLTGKNIDWQNIPQETWETIYMTMLTTPFINKMGEGFQNNKYSAINKRVPHNFNGFNVEYSQAELLQFTDANGNLNQQEFFAYLMEHNRIKNIDSKILQEYRQNLEGIKGFSNDDKATVIDVSQIDTNGQGADTFTHGVVDPNIMNMSYKGFNFVYKTSGDASSVIQQVVNENRSGKILIELDSTIGLTQEDLAKLPPNVEIRVLGGYGMEYFKGNKANGSSLATLQKATYSVSEMQDIMSKITTFENGIDPKWSDLEKARYAYDFLVKNFEYNPKPGGIMVRGREYVGLTSLLENRSTCQGFAQTYQELLTRMGIECTSIAGALINPKDQHAFNVVTIDGKKYIVDTVRERLGDTFKGTGFGVDEKYFGEYIFKSNTELKNMLQDGKSLNNITDNTETSGFKKLAKMLGSYLKNMPLGLSVQTTVDYLQNELGVAIIDNGDGTFTMVDENYKETILNQQELNSLYWTETLTKENSSISKVIDIGNNEYIIKKKNGSSIKINATNVDLTQINNWINSKSIKSIDYVNGKYVIKNLDSSIVYKCDNLGMESYQKFCDTVKAKQEIAQRTVKSKYLALTTTAKNHILKGQTIRNTFQGVHSYTQFQKMLDQGKIRYREMRTLSNGLIEVRGLQMQIGNDVWTDPKGYTTLFPQTWSDNDIVKAVINSADTDPVGATYEDGKSWKTVHRSMVNGVPIIVIKSLDGNIVTAIPESQIRSSNADIYWFNK